MGAMPAVSPLTGHYPTSPPPPHPGVYPYVDAPAMGAPPVPTYASGGGPASPAAVSLRGAAGAGTRATTAPSLP
jgi:hypothetical protein